MEIKRDEYLNKLINSMNNGLIKVITGLRRSGKSYLLRVLFKNYLIKNKVNEEDIVDIALDLSSNEALRNPINLTEYLKNNLSKKKRMFLFIDEIQRCEPIPNPYFDAKLYKNKKDIPQITFHSILNEILSEYKNVDCYVTGSNSKMLSKDVLTSFRGRAWEIKVFPLSFKEYNDALKGNEMNNFNNYLKYGGMPLLLSFNSESDKKEYLNSLLTETYIKDIVERNHFENSNLLKELTKVLASISGSLTNITKLLSTFKTKENNSFTRAKLEEYINALKDAFLIIESNRYDIRGKKIIEGQNKYYFTDTGLRNSCLNFSSNDYGFMMESIIYLELIKRRFTVNIGALETWESKSVRKQYEVDFIASLNDKKFYIQSSYDIFNEEKLNQERKSLNLVNNNFKKIIVYFNNFTNNYDEDGILHVNIIKFLLDYDILS